MREVLCDKLAEISSNLGDNFPLVREHCWLGDEEAEVKGCTLEARVQLLYNVLSDISNCMLSGCCLLAGPKAGEDEDGCESLLYEVVCFPML